VYALGTRPLAQYGADWEYLLTDALGSVRQIVDADGNVTLAESYEPYGSVLTRNGTASSIFGYAGEQIDTSGLVYLRARYMNPRLGIFLARDPWSGDQLRPGSMNGFGYVEGDPVNATDPSAWCANCIFGTIAQVNDSSGVNLRSMPHVDGHLMETLPFNTKVFVISPQTFRSSYKKPDNKWVSIDWRYVGTPWQTRTTRGWVADDYIESVCHISWPNCPPRDDDGGGGPGPAPDLNFGFTFTDWPLDPHYGWGPFGNSMFAYCNQAITNREDHPECNDYYIASPPYGDLHGLHSGIDLGTTANATVKWTVNQVGKVVKFDYEYGDATPNVVIEVGNYWIDFGHTVRNEKICEHGILLNPGDEIGTIQDQGSNTHLHLSIALKSGPLDEYPTYFVNPASAFPDPNYWTDYAPAPYNKPIKGFQAGSSGSYWDGTFTPDN
jgi:RHS repeat-associated protein